MADYLARLNRQSLLRSALAALLALALALAGVAEADTEPVLVKDINPGSGDALAFISALTNVDGTLFFFADDGVHGLELWKSDGTRGGTVLVKDINSGPGDSFENLFDPDPMTQVNGVLVFPANDGVHGWELWRSDGTEAGTVLVKDIKPGSDGSFPGGLINVAGTLFFGANDGVHGWELWKSDGTEAGTVLVKDIRPGASYSLPYGLTNVNGTLFFSADDGVHGEELWKSNGTEAGTVLVEDIYPGSGNGSRRTMTNVAGTLFFPAADGVHGFELWKSDGTEAGTVLVKDIYPGSGRWDPIPHNLTDVGGTLFFSAFGGLWKSDSTEAGTVLVKDVSPGDLTVVAGTLFFTADDGVHGRELWKSNGTEAGTLLVKDIYPGSSSSVPAGGATVPGLTAVDGTLFFTATDAVHGNEVWRSDGTEAGTVLVKDINPGSGGSKPFTLTNVNGTLFFSADDGVHGRELRKLAPPNGEPPPPSATISIKAGDTWQYFKGKQEPPSNWKEVTFDDSTWSSGPSGFGYGDGDDATVLTDMEGGYVAVFIRKTVTLSDPSSMTELVLSVDYDDAFVAYLNGVEVARANIFGDPVRYNYRAYLDHEASGGDTSPQPVETFALSSNIDLLVPGENVLAIQGHNKHVSSSDFTLIPSLEGR